MRCLLKDISHLELWWPFSAEKNSLCNFGNEYYEKHFCKISNLDQWFMRCHLKVFLISRSSS